MINKLLIQQRLSMIDDFCRELELLQRMPEDLFLEKRNTAAAESFLRRSLEAIFDVGRHILAKSGHLDLAGEYKSIARGLAKQNIITEQMADTLIKMAGYRNRLVHLYHQVTDEELYSIVQNNIVDLREFTKQINSYLTRLE